MPETPQPAVPLETLLAAPEELSIGGRQLILKTALWRDFMPIAPPEGHPLIAAVTLTAADGEPLPPLLAADRLWVIQDAQAVWESGFSEEPEPPQGPGEKRLLQKIARGGPLWGPGIAVDVVVRILDQEGAPHYLKAARQPIERTD